MEITSSSVSDAVTFISTETKRRPEEGGGDKDLLEEMQVILQPALTKCAESNNARRTHAHTYALRRTRGGKSPV